MRDHKYVSRYIKARESLNYNNNFLLDMGKLMNYNDKQWQLVRR